VGLQGGLQATVGGSLQATVDRDTRDKDLEVGESYSAWIVVSLLFHV
jgi:hypothetical protein